MPASSTSSLTLGSCARPRCDLFHLDTSAARAAVDRSVPSAGDAAIGDGGEGDVVTEVAVVVHGGSDGEKVVGEPRAILASQMMFVLSSIFSAPCHS